MFSIQIITVASSYNASSEPLTSRVQETLAAALEGGERVFFVAQKSTFYAYIVCQDCEEVLYCKNCDVSLIMSREDDYDLTCPVCRVTYPDADVCPACSSHRLKRMGCGVSRLNQVIAKQFPDTRICAIEGRIDPLEYAHLRDAQIIIGTPVLVNSLELFAPAYVVLVQWESILELFRYDAEEKLRQLLGNIRSYAQGQYQKGREVVFHVQSLKRNVASVKNYLTSEYTRFYHDEINLREAHGLPPVYEAVSLHYKAREKAQVDDFIKPLEEVVQHIAQVQKVRLTCNRGRIYKKRGLYDGTLVLTGLGLSQILAEIPRALFRKVTVEFDVR